MNYKEQLDATIPPECIALKQGLSYVSHRYVKDTLNEVFGHDGWSYEVIHIKADRDRMECFVHVRLSAAFDTGATVVRDGLAVGFLPLPNDPNKHEAWSKNSQGFDFAVAEAVTDALKRAAVSLGNVMGLQLYPLTPGSNSAPKAGASARRRVVRK